MRSSSSHRYLLLRYILYRDLWAGDGRSNGALGPLGPLGGCILAWRIGTHALLRVLRQELMMNLKTPVSAPLVQAEKHRGVAGRSSFDHYYVLPLGAMQHGDQCRDASSSHMVVSANDSQRSEAALSLSSTGF